MNQKLESHLKGFDTKKIKCPFCGGKINQLWFDTTTISNYAYFVAECYTPSAEQDPDKVYEKHIFRFAMALPETLFFDRKEDEDNKPTNEWVQRK